MSPWVNWEIVKEGGWGRECWQAEKLGDQGRWEEEPGEAKGEASWCAHEGQGQFRRTQPYRYSFPVFLTWEEGKKWKECILAPPTHTHLSDTMHTHGTSVTPPGTPFMPSFTRKHLRTFQTPGSAPLADRCVSWHCSLQRSLSHAGGLLTSGPFLKSPQLNITRCCFSSLRNGSPTVWVTFLLIHT